MTKQIGLPGLCSMTISPFQKQSPSWTGYKVLEHGKPSKSTKNSGEPFNTRPVKTQLFLLSMNEYSISLSMLFTHSTWGNVSLHRGLKILGGLTRRSK